MLLLNREKPLPYVTGEWVNKKRVKLNGKGDNICPRCKKGILIRDNIADIACLNCGWRESFYIKGHSEMSGATIARLMFNAVDVLK